MQVPPGVFKAYDIRGVVPAAIDAPFAHALGLAFAHRARAAGERAVAVARDGRVTGPELKEALVRGLVAGGIDVADIGMVTTPMLYYAAHTVTGSGIQVTASHNPREHNGFKMVLARRHVHGEALQALRRAMEQGSAPAARPGRVTHREIFAAYCERIRSDVRLARPMKVVVDCGNGVPGATTPHVLRALGCEVVELFTEVDGTFPNHHPDPAKADNLRDLVARVGQSDAELGLAFDGDGDRLGVVTRSGGIVAADRLMMLFARDVLARQPGAAVVYDVKSTQRLAPVIEAAGGRPVMHKSGYPQLQARMFELGAPFAGEMSGHIFFADRWYGCDDATYCAARLLEILARHPDPSALLDALPAGVCTPELHVPCAEGEAHRIAAHLAATASFPDARVCTIDGLRVDWPDGFGLVRASNTTSVLTLRFEGHTREAMERIEARMLALLRAVKPDARYGP